MNDGKIIKLPVPPPTQERRKELVKVAHDYAERARTAVRNVRREANDELKQHGEGQVRSPRTSCAAASRRFRSSPTSTSRRSTRPWLPGRRKSWRCEALTSGLTDLPIMATDDRHRAGASRWSSWRRARPAVLAPTSSSNHWRAPPFSSGPCEPCAGLPCRRRRSWSCIPDTGG